jgi:protein-disulfide isomerase
MKKTYLWIGTILLIVLIIFLMIIKLSWQKYPEKSVTDLGNEVKAESFAPASQPTISADEKVIGSTRAAVKIVVYEDYSNVFSANNAENVKKLEEEFGSKIVVAVRPYASREKLLSLDSAMAIECAGEQKKWEEMRLGIFNAVKNNSLNIEGINGLAKQIGLDQDDFIKCLTNVKKQGIMLQVASDAQRFSVYGAPTIFINDELIAGARPYDDYADENGVKIEGLRNLVIRHLNK